MNTIKGNFYMKTKIFYDKKDLTKPYREIISLAQILLLFSFMAMIVMSVFIYMTKDQEIIKWSGYCILNGTLFFIFFITPMILHLVLYPDFLHYMNLGEESRFVETFKLISYNVLTKNLRLDDKDNQIMVSMKLEGVENMVTTSLDILKNTNGNIRISGKQKHNKKWRYIYDFKIIDS